MSHCRRVCYNRQHSCCQATIQFSCHSAGCRATITIRGRSDEYILATVRLERADVLELLTKKLSSFLLLYLINLAYLYVYLDQKAFIAAQLAAGQASLNWQRASLLARRGLTVVAALTAVGLVWNVGQVPLSALPDPQAGALGDHDLRRDCRRCR